jgi:hypothetical protein
VEPIASYEKWSRIVREPLIWLIHDGHTIVLGRVDRHDKVQRWTLVKAQDAGFAGMVSVVAGEVAAKS